MVDLYEVPNPCCGKPGPCWMDAPDYPSCHCGKPSAVESGLCAPCAKVLEDEWKSSQTGKKD